MVPLSTLWVPILVSAVLVFVASSFIHMVLPYHKGDYRKVIEGINNTLDAVVNPLTVAANYIDRISKGDMPEKISDSLR